MHKLDRSSVQAPECLETARREGRSYKRLKTHEIREIRRLLIEMQHQRCAYCERRTDEHARYGGHIEHFRDQAGHGEHDLDWHNLFWSCLDERTCGKHKDKCRKHSGKLARFDCDDLIDPCVDDPEHYLVFVSNGTVRVRTGLTEDERSRATETIRVFQLEGPAHLRKFRQDAVRPYIVGVSSLMQYGAAIVATYIESQMEHVSNAPFATAIKHFFESVNPE